MSKQSVIQQRPDRWTASSAPTLSVIVPAYNEQATLLQMLGQIVAERTSKEIIVVDDGSTDRTPELMEEWFCQRGAGESPDVDVVLLRHETNQGKGSAIRSGLAHARGEYVVVQDADLEVFPADYQNLLQPLLAGDAEFVIGSRQFVGRDRLSVQRLGIRFLNGLVRWLYGYRFSDSACCFKVLPRSALSAMGLQCRNFEFCPEVIAKAARMKLTACEVPVAYSPRSVSEGKKLRLIKDGVIAMSTLLKHRRWMPGPIGDESVEVERARSEAAAEAD